MAGAVREFERLLEIMAKLRGPEGCPWDREQTPQSLRRYVIEEAYEVVDAIEREDWDGLAEELGDLQLQIVFQAQLARDEGRFDIARVLEAINEKLLRRHPHVFGNESLDTPEAVALRWDELKAREKPGSERDGLLGSVRSNQPAMLEARQMGRKAAQAGFDWETFEAMGAKLEEEFREVAEARRSEDPGAVEDEVGDLLFMAVNVARRVGVDPELALKRANAKFRERFSRIEAALSGSGRRVSDCGPDELDRLWRQAKAG